jgi:uncharacterized coiled-coil protein SlyX|tara:strand:- start:396 stop:866 length:471 start_codon:yes stop_codon:yes gene_type:complete
MSTELDVGGVKLKGGKAFSALLAIGTMIGALYGAFEVYKTYEDMKEAIGTYEAPDLSVIEERISVLEERIASQNTTITSQASEFGSAVSSMRTVVDLSKESINRIDGDLQSLFSDVRSSDKRLYELERDTGKELIEIRQSIRNQIEEALANPLAGQ